MKRLFSRSLWTASRLLALAPPILFLILAIVISRREFTTSRADILKLIERQISAIVKLDIKAGDVDTSLPGRLVVKDLIISKPGFGPLLRTPRATARYNISTLLRAKNALASVTSVDVQQPSVFLQRGADGNLNFASAFKPRKKSKQMFRGIVSVREGTVFYRDFSLATKAGQPLLVAVRNVNGRVDFRSGQGGSFRVAAAGSTASGPVTVEGAFDSKSAVISAAGSWISIPLAAEHMPLGPNLYLSDGVVSGRLVLTYRFRTGGGLHYYLDGSFKGLSGQWNDRIPAVEDVSGRVRLANREAVVIEAEGFSMGSPFKAKGMIADLRKPTVAISASMPRAPYSAARRLLPAGSWPKDLTIQGSGPVEVTAAGPIDRLNIKARALLPRLSWKQYSIDRALVRLNISDSSAGFSGSGEMGGGSVTASGYADLTRPPVAEARIRFADVPLEAFDKRISGRSSGQAAVSYRNGRLTGSGSILATDVTALGRKATSVRARGRFDGRRLTIEQFLASTRAGFITANGSAGLDQSLMFNVTALGLDIASAGVVPGAKGKLDAAGVIGGSIADPFFEGRIQISDLVYNAERVDGLTGRVRLSKNEISSPGLLVLRGISEINVSGRVSEPLEASRRLDLKASAQAIDLSEAAKYIPALSGLKGRLSGEISRIRGPALSPEIHASLRIEDGRYNAFALPLVTLKAVYSRGSISFEELVAARGSASLRASGSANRKGKLDFNYALSDLPVSDAVLLTLGRPAPVTGAVSSSGHIGGTLRSPAVTGTISSTALNVAGEHIGATESGFAWQDGKLTLSRAFLEFAGGIVSFDDVVYSSSVDKGDVLKATIRVGRDLDGNLNPVQLSRLLAVARSLGLLDAAPGGGFARPIQSLPEVIQGSLAAEIEFGRDERGITAEGSAVVSGLVGWGAQLGTLNVTGSYSTEGIIIKRMTLEDQDMTAALSGRYLPDGKIEADLEANNISLERLSAIQGAPKLSGVGDVSARAWGTISSPKVEASVLVRGAEVAGYKFDEFSTGRVLLDESGASFNDLTVTVAGSKLSFQGSLPFSVAGLGMINQGKIDLHGRLVNATLKMLSIATPMLDRDSTEGEINGSVNVSGTWPSPKIEGNLSVREGSIGFKGIKSALRNIEIGVNFTGNRVQISQFSISSSDGGALKATGGAFIGEKGWQSDVECFADGFTLNLYNFSGAYKESFSGRIDGRVGIKGPLAQPMIAGSLKASNGYIGLPTLVERETAYREYAVNPAFDLILAIGRKMKAKGPRLNVDIAGEGRILQDLKHPVIAGKLSVLSGYMIVPGGRFRVVPIGVIDFRFEPPNPARLNLDVRARTTISSRTASNGVVRTGRTYRVDMVMTGPLSDPTVRFSSEPPGLDSTSVLSMLGQQAGIGPGGFGVSDFEKELVQVFTANVAPGVLEPIETALADAFGLEEVAFGFGHLEPINVQVTRKLFGNLSLTYWRSLSAVEDAEEWRFRYDVTRNLSLAYGESRYGDRTAGFESSFKF